MARRPEGWTLQEDPRTGFLYVRFRHAGRRRNLSTGETNRRAAQVEAARIYAEVVSGRRRAAEVAVARVPLEDALGGWLEAFEVQHPETFPQYAIYASSYFIPFFRRLDAITSARAEDYVIRRLRSVKRKTVLKELSALRGFLKWCKRRGFIEKVPMIESPSSRTIGTPTKKQKRKPCPIVLTEVEVDRLLEVLPESTAGGRCRPRAFYSVLWETGLRHGTLARLRAPEHYRSGDALLRIASEIDKSRYGRGLPLTARARAALDAVCPDVGLIFGDHNHRIALRSAAVRAGLPEHKCEKLSDHDFRHSRITFMASRTKNLAGVAYLAGHKHITTTNEYVRPGLQSGLDVLEDLAPAELAAAE